MHLLSLPCLLTLSRTLEWVLVQGPLFTIVSLCQLDVHFE